MPISITTKEIISATLGLELNGQPIPGTISPQIGFVSSNAAVLGVKDDPVPNTLDLQITGQGEANLTISADCTFVDPQTGEQITRNKSKTLSVSVVSQGSDFVVAFE